MTDLAVRDPEVIVQEQPAIDRSRLPISVASLAFLALGLIGWITGIDELRGVGFMFYVLFGLGSAILIVMRQSTCTALAFSTPIGVSLSILAGFTMAETHIWGVGEALFVILVVASACVHAFSVRNEALSGGFRRMRDSVLDSDDEIGAEDSDEDPGGEIRFWSRYNIIVATLSAVGLGACLVSAAAIYNFDPTTPAALFGRISPAWYFGMLVLAVAVVLGFRFRGSGAALPIVAISLAATMTPSLAYAEPHLPWAAKHVGVTLYIMAHGSVNSHIDILQAWPGLFAGVAWLCQSIGIHDPMVIARWWQPVIDLTTVLVFQQLAFRALGDMRRSWIAAVLLVLGNVIGQDYFSPQSTGFLLAITLFALLYRRRDEPIGMTGPDLVLVFGMTMAVVVTHELTPFIVFGVSVVLVVFGQIRTKYFAPVMLVFAVAWAFKNRSVVSHYFSFNQIGSGITSNILTKGLANPSVHKSSLIHFDSYAMAADLLIIGLVALVVLLRERTRTHLMFALCALSGLGLFLGSSYGNEGSLRVTLFALPWLAILAADWKPLRGPKLAWLPVIAIPAILACYLFATLGLEYIRVVRTGDLTAIRKFETTAPGGSDLYILGQTYAPIRSTARYPLFYYHYYPEIVTPGNDGAHFSPVKSYGEFLSSRVPQTTRALEKANIYVLSAQQPSAAMVELNLATLDEYQQLTSVFARSSSWQLVIKTDTASLFRLRSLILQTRPLEVDGLAQSGNVVTASDARWVSTSRVRYSYQWTSCNVSGDKCSAIVNAKSKSYVVSEQVLGHTLRVKATARNSQGSVSTVTSAPTAEVTGAAGT